VCALGYSRACFLQPLCNSTAENRVYSHILRLTVDDVSSSKNGLLVIASIGTMSVHRFAVQWRTVVVSRCERIFWGMEERFGLGFDPNNERFFFLVIF
jgi:hypothetical protein